MIQSEQWLTRAELAEACGVSIVKISEMIHTHPNVRVRIPKKDKRRRLFLLSEIQQCLSETEETVNA